jgi:hypothetical protein
MGGGDGVEGTNKMDVSSGFVSSGTFSSAEEGPRGLPLVNRPIMSRAAGYTEWNLVAGGGKKSSYRARARGLLLARGGVCCESGRLLRHR